MFLLFSFLYMSNLHSEFFKVRALLCFSCHLVSRITVSVLGGKKKNQFYDKVDNIKQMFWQISGRLYCLVNKFRTACKVLSCFDSKPHWHMWFQHKQNLFFSSSERLYSLMHNLRVLLAFVNQLKSDNFPGPRTAKFSLQVPDFIAFEIWSKHCWSFLSKFMPIYEIWQ